LNCGKHFVLPEPAGTPCVSYIASGPVVLHNSAWNRVAKTVTDLPYSPDMSICLQPLPETEKAPTGYLIQDKE